MDRIRDQGQSSAHPCSKVQSLSSFLFSSLNPLSSPLLLSLTLSYLILLILHYIYHHHRKHLQHAIVTLIQTHNSVST